MQKYVGLTITYHIIYSNPDNWQEIIKNQKYPSQPEALRYITSTLRVGYWNLLRPLVKAKSSGPRVCSPSCSSQRTRWPPPWWRSRWGCWTGGPRCCSTLFKIFNEKRPFCEQHVTFMLEKTSVPDQDPHVFGPPESGSICQRYGSGSGSFYHQAKIVRKSLIPTVLWLILDFLSFKNDVNIPSKSKKQKNFPNSDQDPLVRGMDPRIRIHTKMSWIRNTERN
jgi:hypothetical protein